MKMKKSLLLVVLMSPFSILGFVNGNKHEINEASAVSVNGCSLQSKLPSKITLVDTEEDVIRSYYSPLTSLSEEERKGDNLLKNLKPILFNMNYFTYDNVWKIYEITDRDWSLSPAKDDKYGDYDETLNEYTKYVYSSSNSNTKNNPYVHTLYRDHEDESGYIKEWGDHNQSGTNREHVWPQSRGFKKEGSGAEGPAGTDIHHLISGDGTVNQIHHNNNPYGFVKTQDQETTGKNKEIPFIAGNKTGTALHTFSQDQSTVVFEPQDSDKGDIARACFYMVARYNNLSGHDTISQFEPNLTLLNYATSNSKSEISSASNPVGLGILQDLLEWNKLDPVDEYEIHRNNLIYENYQGNRNPFVDFPQWADAIWGSVDAEGNYDNTPVGSADPSKDVLNDSAITLSKTSLSLSVNETVTISASTKEEGKLTWTSVDTSIVSLNKESTVSNEEVSVTAHKEGKTSIKVSIGEYSKTLNVNVTSGEPEKVKDNKSIIIIAIVAAVVVIVLIVVIVIIFKNSNKKTQRKMKSTMKKTVKKTARTYTKNQNKKS